MSYATTTTMAAGVGGAAAATAAVTTATAGITAVTGIVDKCNLLSYLGYRVTLDLDDGTTMTGRLVSLGATGNVVLTDAEREWPHSRKRTRRDDDARTQNDDTRSHAQRQKELPPSRVRRECYTSVLFVRGSSIAAVRYNSGITSDRGVVDTLGNKEGQLMHRVQLANLSPAVPLQ